MKIVFPFADSFLDYFDNENVCTSIYMVGCEHNCKNCHNKELQDFNTSLAIDMSVNDIVTKVEENCQRLYSQCVSIMGGEPLHPKNIFYTKWLLSNLTSNGYSITLYTGYDINYVRHNGVRNFTFIKTGKYDENVKQESIKTDKYIQLASKNQQIFDSDYNLLSNNGRMYFK